MTKIEWAQETWNPITGCTPISEGCANCYAARMSKRLAGRFGYPAKEPFSITLHEDVLNKPFEWKLPKIIFVCSMGDIFHADVPDEWIDRIFDVISQTPQHTYLILTKRPERMRQYLYDLYDDVGNKKGGLYSHGRPIPNIWVGVTAENQEQANWRVPILMTIPAAVRFVSVEPMLSNVDLTKLEHGGKTINALEMQGSSICWVICGAETGPRKRPMNDAWAESLRDQCVAAKVPFFFKKDSFGQTKLCGIEWREVPYAAEDKLKGGAEECIKEN